jgi:hypothetical protein
MWADLEADFRNPTARRNPFLNKVEVDIVQINLDFAVSYRLCELTFKEGRASPALSLELIGGTRYVYMKQEIVPTIRSEFSPKLGKSKDWVEPFVGGKIILRLTEKLGIAVRGDFGGFGVGSASTKTWNFTAGFGYRFTDSFELRAGYHIFDIDYINGSGSDGFGMDGKLDGPKLGLTYHF